MPVRLDVYGRFRLRIERTPGGFRILEEGADGKRRLRDDLARLLPGDLADDEIPAALDTLLHELGGPELSIRVID